MSNFGKALEKVVKQPGDVSGGDGTFQKQFEYEDRVTIRRVEASEQIRDMYQPRLYNKRERKALRFISADEHPEQSSVFEEMRNIISRGHQGSSGRITLITSVAESPAVNVFARNLAAILVKDESITSLLIDLLGSKETIQLSESSDQAGLSDYINNDNIPVKNIIYPTGIERMRVIPRGSMDYSTGDLIRTTRMRMLLKDVTKRYRERHTIIVAPSIPRVADVELLNEYVNQIILAVPYGRSSKKDFVKSMGKLDKDKFIGTILLDVVPLNRSLGKLFGVG